jgi:hypothetical protein
MGRVRLSLDKWPNGPGWYIIIVSIFAKGNRPKIFTELNLEWKYSNPHLNLNTLENGFK